MARPEARDLVSLNEVDNQTYTLWLQNILKPASTRYVLAMIKQKNISIIEESIREEVFDIVLPMLEKELSRKQFITGNALAAIDISYFMELQQIQLVTPQPVKCL